MHGVMQLTVVMVKVAALLCKETHPKCSECKVVVENLIGPISLLVHTVDHRCSCWGASCRCGGTQ
jgi:hypothetical protein